MSGKKRKGSGKHNKTPPTKFLKAREEEEGGSLSMSVQNLLRGIEKVFGAHRNTKKANPMAAYMKDKFPFFGIQAKERQDLTKNFASECRSLSMKELKQVVSELWLKPEREFQQFALQVLSTRLHAISVDKRFEENINFAEKLITEKSWWDTVDCLSSGLVGSLVKEHPIAGKETMEKWIKNENMWLRRAAILHQLKRGADTDEELLFKFCKDRAHEKEFFIQKAIGWALRQHARSRGKAVEKFLKENKNDLSRLSYREASKHLNI